MENRDAAPSTRPSCGRMIVRINAPRSDAREAGSASMKVRQSGAEGITGIYLGARRLTSSDGARHPP